MFKIGNDRVIGLGKGVREMNLIVMIPKSNVRSNGSDVSINRVLMSRLGDSEAVEALAKEYMRKNSHRLKKRRVKIELQFVTQCLQCKFKEIRVIGPV